MPRKFVRKMRKRVVRKRARAPFSKRQAKAIIKLSKKSSELKMKEDLDNNDASFTATAPTTHNLSQLAIAQGTDNDERIGDKIKIKDLTYLLRIKPGSAGYDTTNGHVYRIYAVQYLGSNTPASLDGINALDFFPNAETADVKYKILHNRIYKINPDSQETKYHMVRLNGNKMKQIVFDDAATSVSQNNIKFNVVPLTTTVDQLQSDLSVKIRYYDN